MLKAQRRCTGHGSIEVRHRPDAEAEWKSPLSICVDYDSGWTCVDWPREFRRARTEHPQKDYLSRGTLTYW
jgi:hypothetical protein